ncbi:MAG: PAS domain-containing protein, partial [Spirochaetota bacterium]
MEGRLVPVEGRVVGDKVLASVLEKAVVETNLSIVITDRRGRIVFVNPSFTRITGFTEEEVLGRNPRILKSGLVDPSVYEDLWRTISSGGQWVGDFINRAQDGTLFHEHASIAPVTGHDGEITHYVGVKEDVTEQKRTVADLRRTNARLQSILESQRFFVVRVDPHGRYTYANETFLNTFGFTRERLMDMYFHQITHPDDVDAVLAAVQDAAASPGKTVAVSSRKPLPDRSVVWVDWDLVAIEGAGEARPPQAPPSEDLEIQAVGHRAEEIVAAPNAPARLGGGGRSGGGRSGAGGSSGGLSGGRQAGRDAREAAREREQDLRRVLDAVDNLVFVFDDELRILEVNEAVSDLLGTPRRALLGRTMFDAVQPMELGEFALVLDEVRNHAETRSRTRVIGRGGEPVDLELACRRMEFRGRPAVLCSGRRRRSELHGPDGGARDGHAGLFAPERLRERGGDALESVARTLADLRGNLHRYEPQEVDAILSTLEATVAGV